MIYQRKVYGLFWLDRPRYSHSHVNKKQKLTKLYLGVNSFLAGKSLFN